MWSELLAKNLTMKEIQAYIILRGSQLSGDDKKRVLVESGAEADGALTQTRVNQAIRMLGSNFFQDYVGFRKAKTKTYDSQTLLADAVNSEEGDNDIYAAEADSLDDSSWLEHLTQEGDPDAILVSEYETALSETVQEDNELASCYNAYVEARHRLTERFKSRGFWPIKGKGKTGKGFGKGKKGSKKSLEQRILSSTCRLCGQRGHWKAECPQRFSHNPSSSSNTGGVPTASTSFVDLSQDQSLPLEFMQLPGVHESTIDEPPPQLSSIVLFGDVSNMSVTMGIINRLRNRNLRNRTQAPAPLHDVHKPTIVRDDKPTCTSGSQSCFDPPRTDLNHRKDLNAQSIDPAEPVCFASHSSFGVVDLGASKTVIGSKGVQELLEALHPEVKAKCYRTPCVINFRFGNQGMLASQWALVIPLNPSLHLKVPVVPGNTPVLLSNALLRTLGAVIDTKRSELWSHEHQFQIPLTLTNRGLFLLDINQLLSHMWPSLKADHRSCPKPKLMPRDNLSDTIVGVESKSRSFQQQLPLITEPSNDETTVTCHAIDDKSHDVPSNHTGELEVTGNSMDKHKCVPTSNLDQKTNTSLSSSPSCDFGVCCHGHVVGSFEEGSNRCCREVTAGHSSSGSRGGEDSLREETPSWDDPSTPYGRRIKFGYSGSSTTTDRATTTITRSSWCMWRKRFKNWNCGRIQFSGPMASLGPEVNNRFTQSPKVHRRPRAMEHHQWLSLQTRPRSWRRSSIWSRPWRCPPITRRKRWMLLPCKHGCSTSRRPWPRSSLTWGARHLSRWLQDYPDGWWSWSRFSWTLGTVLHWCNWKEEIPATCASIWTRIPCLVESKTMCKEGVHWCSGSFLWSP